MLIISVSWRKDQAVIPTIFNTLFSMKAKTPKDTLFKQASPDVQRLRKQATAELRAKARREWKAKHDK